MMLQLKLIFFVVIAGFLSSKAQAQFAAGGMWGTGMYGAAGACPYEPQIGDAATSIADEISDIKDKMKDKSDELREAKKKLSDAKSKLSDSQRKFQRSGFTKDSDAYSRIDDHITQGKSCGDYSKNEDTKPWTPEAWAQGCDAETGKLKGSALCKASFGKGQDGYRHKEDRSECVSSLDDWQKSVKQVAEATAEVENKKADLAALKEDMRVRARDYKAEVISYQKELRQDATEGGCVECMMGGSGAVYKPQKPSGWDVAGNVALGLGSMYIGKAMYNDYANNSAAAGYQPMQPPPTFAYGFPYMMGALYGAVGGGGMAGGSFGCGAGMSGGGFPGGPYGMMGPFGLGSMYGPMGGAMGYPAGMYPTPPGGGMFSPGMYPWGGMPMGMGGGMGGGMGMNPYGMMGPMMGGMGGGMGMPGMGMGMPMGMGGGFGMPGMGMGGGFGMPGMGMGGGFGMPGMGMGGMGGMGMNPYGMGGMGMGMPGMGMNPYGMGGGMGMGMPGMGMNPYGMGGGMGMPGMSGFGMPGMGMGGGMGGMDPMGSQMQMQMQMQMMQTQMQQAQAQMQMQQRRLQNYMAQQQVIGGLYQEMQTLAYRIQQAQMAAQTGGTLGDYSFGAGVSGSPVPGPMPGSMPNNGTTNGPPTVR